MKKDSMRASFYIEAVILVLIFLVVTTILVSVFGISMRKSMSARHTELGIQLAENALNVFRNASSEKEMEEYLNECENLMVVEDNDHDHAYFIFYDADGNADRNGEMHIFFTLDSETGETGELVTARVEAYHLIDDFSIFEAEESKYVRGGQND